MPHLITGVTGLLIILCTRRLYDRNFELFLCILIVINYEFFLLVPRFSEYGIYREILLPIVLFCFIENRFLLRLINEYREVRFTYGRYGRWIIVYLVHRIENSASRTGNIKIPLNAIISYEIMSIKS